MEAGCLRSQQAKTAKVSRESERDWLPRDTGWQADRQTEKALTPGDSHGPPWAPRPSAPCQLTVSVSPLAYCSPAGHWEGTWEKGVVRKVTQAQDPQTVKVLWAFAGGWGRRSNVCF